MDDVEYCQCSRPDQRTVGDDTVCVRCGCLIDIFGAESSTDEALEAALDADPGNPSDDQDNGEFPAPVEMDKARPGPPAQELKFVHAKLSGPRAFRLLRLLPGKHADPIVVDVFHADLSDAPDFEAVSYTWATPVRSSAISTPTGTMQVTPNCAAALRDLRLAFGERALWLDAICINQADNAEKSRQVALINAIFGRAQRVLVYLGRSPSPPPGAAVPTDFGALFDYLKRQQQPQGRSGDDEDEADRVREKQQAAASALLSLPWFSRVWVLQEVAVAAEALVIVGSSPSSSSSSSPSPPSSSTATAFSSSTTTITTLDWKRLSLAHLPSRNIDPVDCRGVTPPVLRFGGGGGGADKKPLKDAASLLHVARACRAADPRDNIYALLGLLEDPAALPIAADYGKSVVDLYVEVAVSIVESTRTLDLLSDVGEKPRLGWRGVLSARGKGADEHFPRLDLFYQAVRCNVVSALRNAEAAARVLENVGGGSGGGGVDRGDGAGEKEDEEDEEVLRKRAEDELALLTRAENGLARGSAVFRPSSSSSFPSEEKEAEPGYYRIFHAYRHYTRWRFPDAMRPDEDFGYAENLQRCEALLQEFVDLLQELRWLSRGSEETMKEKKTAVRDEAREVARRMQEGAAALEESATALRIKLGALREWLLAPTIVSRPTRPTHNRDGEREWEEEGDEGEARRQALSSLPSWVPDFSKQPSLPSLAPWRSVAASQKSGESRPAAPPVARLRTPPEGSSETAALEVQALKLDSVALGGGWRCSASSGEAAVDKGPDPEFWAHGRLAETFRFWAKFEESFAKVDHGSAWKAVERFALPRTFVETERSFAACPGAARALDGIYAIKGATVPFLLRKVPEKEGAFWLVGECYLHGFKGPKRFEGDYLELLGWYKQFFEEASSQDELPWETIYLE